MVHSVLANKIAYGKIADIQGDPQVRFMKMCGESRTEI